MVCVIRECPPPFRWSDGVPCTLIIAPTHLHIDWIRELKGCNPKRVVGRWKQPTVDAMVVLCNVRTLRTVPQPSPLWWRVVFDYTVPGYRSSECRLGARGVCHQIPNAWHTWCMIPSHPTAAEKLYTLDILFKRRTAWMPNGHPEWVRPTRRLGEYGQWLVDVHQWKLQMHIWENTYANIQIEERTLRVHVSDTIHFDDAWGFVDVIVEPTYQWLLLYNAWLVWFKALLYAHTQADGVSTTFERPMDVIDPLYRICSTPSAFQATLQSKSIVWDVHQAMCLLPIRLDSNGKHPEQWEKIKYTLQSTTRAEDAPECIVCTASLFQCPLVVSDCGHIVGACCMPRLIDGGMMPPGYRCPECRCILILGVSSRIVVTTVNNQCEESKIKTLLGGVADHVGAAILVVTHYPESMGVIVHCLRQHGLRVTCGTRFSTRIDHSHIHVVRPFDVISKDLSVFDCGYVYDSGPNVEQLMDMLHRNGLPKTHVMRYLGTIEEKATRAPAFHREDHIIHNL